jgi:hypothetical protein
VGGIRYKQAFSFLLFYLPCFEETTTATKLPPVSTTPAANFAPVSTTLAKLVEKFACGVVDTAMANLPPVSLIPAAFLHRRCG